MGFFTWMFGTQKKTKTEPKEKTTSELLGHKPKATKKAKQSKAKKPIMTKTTLSKMTKKDLEEIVRENGIELDRRLTKLKLVDQLHKHLKK